MTPDQPLLRDLSATCLWVRSACRMGCRSEAPGELKGSRQSDEPIDEYRQCSCDPRGRDDTVRGFLALADQTHRYCSEQEGENPTADVLSAQSEQHRIVDIEVVPVAQLEHHAPEDPCDERGDRGGPEPSARA